MKQCWQVAEAWGVMHNTPNVAPGEPFDSMRWDGVRLSSLYV